MTRRATKAVLLGALLGASSAVPAFCRAHWEGFEAADPATPAALLRIESAVAGYTASEASPIPWRRLSDGGSDSSTADGQSGAEAGAHTHTGHADTATHAPATTQR